MQRVLRLAAGLLLALGLIGSVSAASAADGTSPNTAIPLPANLSASGTIKGSSGGAYIYYTFNSPSSTAVATINLTLNPPDPITSAGAGVDVYQGGGTLASINGVNANATLGFNSATFTPATGPVLIQAYNYRDGQPATISFNITGLTAASMPGAPTPAVGPPPVAGTSPQTAMPLSSSLSASGSILGSSGGAYHFYTFNVPAGGTTGTINLSINPPDPITSASVGVNLYQGGGSLASINGVNANSTLGFNSATFTAAGGPVLIQVYNYRDSQPASYSISVSGKGITP